MSSPSNSGTMMSYNHGSPLSSFTNKHGVTVGPDDVLCGQGWFKNNPGNSVYLELVAANLSSYQEAYDNDDEAQIQTIVVQTMEQIKGRFVDAKTGKELSRKDALAKITRMFHRSRDRARQKSGGDAVDDKRMMVDPANEEQEVDEETEEEEEAYEESDDEAPLRKSRRQSTASDGSNGSRTSPRLSAAVAGNQNTTSNSQNSNNAPASTPSSSKNSTSNSSNKYPFDYRPEDVICGVGKYENKGNLLCVELVSKYHAQYTNADSDERKEILLQISRTIQDKGGRFMDVVTKAPLSEKHIIKRLRVKMNYANRLIKYGNGGTTPKYSKGSNNDNGDNDNNKKRGRNVSIYNVQRGKKDPPTAHDEGEDDELTEEEEDSKPAVASPPKKKRGRGRPRKDQTVLLDTSDEEQTDTSIHKKQRARGRPTSLKGASQETTLDEDMDASSYNNNNKPKKIAPQPPKKRGRGRPRKTETAARVMNDDETETESEDDDVDILSLKNKQRDTTQRRIKSSSAQDNGSPTNAMFRPNDVVCGRGNHQNPGNLYCMELVRDKMDDYDDHHGDADGQLKIVESIYQAIRDKGGVFKDLDSMQVLTRTEALDIIAKKLKRTFARASFKLGAEVGYVAAAVGRPKKKPKQQQQQQRGMSSASAGNSSNSATPNHPSSNYIDEDSFRPHDVICGVGLGRYNQWRGNVLCLDLVADNLELYCHPDTTKEEKSDVLERIYEALTMDRGTIPAGRFIDYNNKLEISKEDALLRINRKLQWARLQRNNDRKAREQAKVLAELDPSTGLEGVFDKLVVGSPIEVFWPEDDVYYTAFIKAERDPAAYKKSLFIEYDDGDTEWIDLSDHVFRLLASGNRINAASARDAEVEIDVTGAKEATSTPDDKRSSKTHETAVEPAGGSDPVAARLPAESAGGFDATAESNPDSQDGAGSDNKATSRPILVNPRRLLRGTMEVEHALKLLHDITFPDRESKQEAVQNLLVELRKERQEIKEWAKARVNAQIVEEARAVLGPDAISTFEDVVVAWSNDCSLDNQIKFHAILHGQFSAEFENSSQQPKPCSPWVLKMELEYMKEKGIEYDHNMSFGASKGPSLGGPRRRNGNGYVYDIISLQLNYQQNIVKSRGRTKHGVHLLSDLSAIRGEEAPKRKKRSLKSEMESGKKAKIAEDEVEPTKVVEDKRKEDDEKKHSPLKIDKASPHKSDTFKQKEDVQNRKQAEAKKADDAAEKEKGKATSEAEAKKLESSSSVTSVDVVEDKTDCTMTMDSTMQSPSKAKSTAQTSSAAAVTDLRASSNQAADSPPKNDGRGQKVIVSRHRLLKTSMDERHAQQFLKGFVFPTSKAKKNATKQLLQQLHDERRAIKAWAKSKIEVTMVKQAREVGMNNVGTYEDLMNSWLTDSSAENRERVRSVLYDPFPLCPDSRTNSTGKPMKLVLEMAESFMRANNLEYSPEDKGNARRISHSIHGYVYDIISAALDEMRQKIKRRGKKRHGEWLEPPKPQVAKDDDNSGGNSTINDGETEAEPEKKRSRLMTKIDDSSVRDGTNTSSEQSETLIDTPSDSQMRDVEADQPEPAVGDQQQASVEVATVLIAKPDTNAPEMSTASKTKDETTAAMNVQTPLADASEPVAAAEPSASEAPIESETKTEPIESDRKAIAQTQIPTILEQPKPSTGSQLGSAATTNTPQASELPLPTLPASNATTTTTQEVSELPLPTGHMVDTETDGTGTQPRRESHGECTTTTASTSSSSNHPDTLPEAVHATTSLQPMVNEVSMISSTADAAGTTTQVVDWSSPVEDATIALLLSGENGQQSTHDASSYRQPKTWAQTLVFAAICLAVVGIPAAKFWMAR